MFQKDRCGWHGAIIRMLRPFYPGVSQVERLRLDGGDCAILERAARDRSGKKREAVEDLGRAAAHASRTTRSLGAGLVCLY